MNQNSPQPSFELPAPVTNGDDAPGAAPFERSTAGPERPPIAQAGSPQAIAPVQPVLPQTPVSVQPIPPTAHPIPAGPAVADDTDLIEKEWVTKAKQIVAATREDPYTQNREISKFKADYLKKRYNKDLKVEGA